jgi:hypothetical protein
MKVILDQSASGNVPLLRVFRADGQDQEGDAVDRSVERQEPAEKDRAETETFWAGRTMAMRRSARVAA